MSAADAELLAVWSAAVAAPPTESGPLWAEYHRQREALAATRVNDSKEM